MSSRISRHIRFSDEEWQRVCEKADASGMKPCSLVRWMVLHGDVKIYDTEIVADLLIQFNSIGRLLNQIAKVVNTSGTVFQKDMEDVRSLMERLRRVFGNYLKQFDPEEII